MRTSRPLRQNRFISWVGLIRISVFIALAAILVFPLFPVSSASLSQRFFAGNSPDLADSSVVSATASRSGVGRDVVRNLSSASTGLETILPLAFMPLPPLVASIETYDSTCTTLQNSFNLGDTVCLKITGEPIGVVGRPATRIAWVSPYGSVAQAGAVTSDPQFSYYAIPFAATQTFTDDGGGEVTVDNRGTWRVHTLSAGDGSRRTTTAFTVHDPAKAYVDLSVHQAVTIAGSEVGSGSAGVFELFVTNAGPDAAQAVVLSDNLSDNVTFSSIIENTGLGFSCGTPVGTLFTCTLASMPAGTTAHLTLGYTVNGDTPVGATITNDVSVSSSGPPLTPCADGSCELQPIDNSSTATAVVPPDTGSAFCTLDCPGNISVTANTTQGGQPGRFVTYPAAQPLGSCGAVSNTPGSGSFLNVGTHIITSNSVSGDSCTFTVTVVDTAAPTISCPPDKTATAPAGFSEATVDPLLPTTIPSSGVTVNGARSDGLALADPYPVGTTLITWTVTDSTNQSASCIQRIIVNANTCGGDITPPTITAPPDVTAYTGTGSTTCGVALSPSDDELGLADADDNCSVTVTANFPAGNLFPVGVTTLTYTATDGAGLTATDTQQVTVIDNTLPVIVAPADASYVCPIEVPAANASQATRGVVLDEDGNPLPPGPPFDNCGTPTVTVADSSTGAGSALSPKVITRTYTATDSHGNIANAVQTITVIDSTLPTITAPADVTANTGPGAASCDATVSLGTPVTGDNCAGVTVTRSPSGNTFAVGSTDVIWTATDAAGNTATAIQHVTVTDNTPPVVTPPANITEYLPSNSTATSMAVSYPNPATATDNCPGSLLISYSPASGSTFSVGTTTVTASTTDAHGNNGSATFTVTVLYNFTGFFSPVNNLPTVNNVNAGKSIPLKFSLSGNKGLDIFPVGFPASQQVACDFSAPISDLEGTDTPGGSTLTYSPDQYHYNWKTESSWAGTCRQLVITLNDGSTRTALFKFK